MFGLLLQEILSNSSADVRLRRKAVFLVADLATYQLENENNLDLDPPSFSNQFFWRSIVDLLASNDIDLQEKVCPFSFESFTFLFKFFQLDMTQLLDIEFLMHVDRIESYMLRMHQNLKNEIHSMFLLWYMYFRHFMP